METRTQTKHAGELPPGVVRVLSNGKRRYADEFKAELVRQCLVRGTSVAATGMAHGINANLLRRWIVLHGAQGCTVAQPPPALLPVTLRRPSAVGTPPAVPACVEPKSIEIEIHGVRVHVHGQVDAPCLGAVLDVLARRT